MSVSPEHTHRRTLGRRRLLAGGLTAASVVAVGGPAVAAAASPASPAVPAAPATLAQPAGADAALARLLAGNERFRHGHATHPHQSPARRQEVAAGQHPFVVLLGCSDSRVPPEVVFDQGLGDIFDIRVAGNVIDDVALGSIEFAVEEFHPPLAVVLGHERCGAVTATIDAIESGATPPGHIGAIVDRLRPVIEPVLGEPGDPVDNGVRANVRAVSAQLAEDSEIVAHAVGSGALRIVGGRYDLDTGRVTVVS